MKYLASIIILCIAIGGAIGAIAASGIAENEATGLPNVAAVAVEKMTVRLDLPGGTKSIALEVDAARITETGIVEAVVDTRQSGNYERLQVFVDGEVVAEQLGVPTCGQLIAATSRDEAKACKEFMFLGEDGCNCVVGSGFIYHIYVYIWADGQVDDIQVQVEYQWWLGANNSRVRAPGRDVFWDPAALEAFKDPNYPYRPGTGPMAVAHTYCKDAQSDEVYICD